MISFKREKKQPKNIDEEKKEANQTSRAAERSQKMKYKNTTNLKPPHKKGSRFVKFLNV